MVCASEGLRGERSTQPPALLLYPGQQIDAFSTCLYELSFETARTLLPRQRVLPNGKHAETRRGNRELVLDPEFGMEAGAAVVFFWDGFAGEGVFV